MRKLKYYFYSMAIFIFIVNGIIYFKISNTNTNNKKSIPNNNDSIDNVISDLSHDLEFVILHSKKELAAGDPFVLGVRGFEVSGAPLPDSYNVYNLKHSLDSGNAIAYWLNSKPDMPLYESLTGLLILYKKDASNVDIIFRSGGFQVGLSPIAICIDNYDLGSQP